MDHNNGTMEYRIGLEKQNKQNDQITELILDNCRASQITGLTDEFVNLETLSLINVGLTTLKGFPKLPKLKRLELGDNRLTGGLNLLHGCPNLQHLNISGNRFKDLEALEPLKEFHNLVILDLYNCEVTKAEGYRKNVFDLLPNLKALDSYDRDGKEVADSDEEDDEGSDVDNHTITRDDNESDDDEEAVDDDGEVGDEEDEDDDDDDDEEGSYGEESDMGDGFQPQDDEAYQYEVSGSSEYDDDDDEEYDEDNIAAREDVQEDNDDDDGDDDDDDEAAEEYDEADLKLLQKDSPVQDEDDVDFEPTHEPDERDHEIDSEDDADEADEDNNVAAEVTETSEAEAADKRGQKRKLEDEGGDEVEETAEPPTKE